MKKSEFFFLAPPVVGNENCGFSVIQIGTDFSEPLTLNLKEWDALHYMKFWLEELSDVVDGRRDVGLLPTGVCRGPKGMIGFKERWEFKSRRGTFVFRERKLLGESDPCDSSCRIPEGEWWRLVKDGPAWPARDCGTKLSVESNAVLEWCNKYWFVMNQMRGIDNDDAY